MSKMDDIKQAVELLAPDELKAFRAWFKEREAQLWDEQIERDVRSGKLNKLADKWRADFKAGKFTDL